MELTLEQALNNVQMVINDFRGTKQEHEALAQSIKVIKDNLVTVE